MDSKIDIIKLRDDNVLKNAGIKAAIGVAVYGNLKKKITIVRHTVKVGDTLWGLARQYNTTVANIKIWNGLSSDIIQPGQVLIVKK